MQIVRASGKIMLEIPGEKVFFFLPSLVSVSRTVHDYPGNGTSRSNVTRPVRDADTIIKDRRASSREHGIRERNTGRREIERDFLTATLIIRQKEI